MFDSCKLSNLFKETGKDHMEVGFAGSLFRRTFGEVIDCIWFEG